MMRWRAREGIWCTKPTRSWLESRKPMPRPMPLSKKDAEREKLKVTMHWYWFQMLTIRSSFGLSVFTLYILSRASQYSQSSAKALSTFSVVSSSAMRA